jgi:hypothetical protein
VLGATSPRRFGQCAEVYTTALLPHKGMRDASIDITFNFLTAWEAIPCYTAASLPAFPAGFIVAHISHGEQELESFEGLEPIIPSFSGRGSG